MSDILATVETGSNLVTASVVGIQGPSGQATTISTISDVDAVAPVNGSLLVYKTTTNKWSATTILDAQDVTGGQY
jgi:hypothetical protein